MTVTDINDDEIEEGKWAYFKYGPLTRHGQVEKVPPYERVALGSGGETKTETELVTIRSPDDRVWRVAPDRVRINERYKLG